MDLNTALRKALDFEEKGHIIYEQASNSTKNPIVERTFRYLADQELIHIEEIKGYIKRKGLELKGDTLNSVRNFFDMNIQVFKEKTLLSDNDLKAHEAALELETNSYNFYKGQLTKALDEDAKKFFKWLMDQENAHYILIKNAYDFIKNPVGFYTEEEKWIADGG